MPQNDVQKELENKGEQVYLRPMTSEDTDRIVAWRNSDTIRKVSFSQASFTKEGHRKWVRDNVDTGKAVQMMICLKNRREPVGCVYIRNIDRNHRKAELGIYIGEEAERGKGTGTRAIEMMIQYGFHGLGLHRIFLLTYADNERAIKSYEKAGFIREAYLRDEVFVNGKFQDVVLMACINPEET